MLNILQTIACEKNFIDSRGPFKCSLFNVCDLIVAKISNEKKIGWKNDFEAMYW